MHTWITRSDAVRCVTEDTSGAHQDLVIRVLGCVHRERWQRHHVTWLVKFLADVSQAQLTAWDAGEVERAVTEFRTRANVPRDARGVVRAAILEAKVHAMFDPTGRFLSHLRKVPRAFLDRYPALWNLPLEFAIWLRNRSFGGEDTALCVEIVDRTTRLAVCQTPHRPAERVRLANSKQVSVILAEIHRSAVVDHQPTTTLLTTFASVTDPASALDVVARAVAFTLRLHGRRTRLPDDLQGHKPRRSLQYFMLLVRAGVFESQGVPCETVLTYQRMYTRMQELERHDPGRYASTETVDVILSEHRLTPDEVESLYGACHNRTETAVLSLLAESAFRAAAIGNARLDDVWDAQRAEVRQRIALVEKGSKIRQNIPSRRLREALRDYVLHERPSGGRWLFPNAFNPLLRSKRIATRVVNALCRRTGIQGVTPHAFRRYVVNTAMRAGNKLETVQKWLGHTHVTTTMRHYWTDDLCALDITVPVLHEREPGSSESRLANQLVEALVEIKRLRGTVAALTADDGRPLVGDLSGEPSSPKSSSAAPPAWWEEK